MTTLAYGASSLDPDGSIDFLYLSVDGVDLRIHRLNGSQMGVAISDDPAESPRLFVREYDGYWPWRRATFRLEDVDEAWITYADRSSVCIWL